ncbi:MAG: hypothetical protein ACOCZ5_03460 [bacterium]
MNYQYIKLNQLLDPELFFTKNTEGNFECFLYTKEAKDRDSVKQEDINEALKEMRKEAGIAMEYLEKVDKNEEAAFLKDWEVIYAADNYKVVADYLQNKLMI